MKVAVIQTHAGSDKAANSKRAQQLVKKAVRAGARFILLPEAYNYRGKPHRTQGLSPIAETIPGVSVRPFMQLGQQYKAHILLGSIAEAVQGSTKVYNTSVLINNKGKIAATYRKINLFNAALGHKRHSESRYLLAGEDPRTAYVGPFAVGLSICYDLRFPVLYQQYARMGAHIMCVPSCFTKATGEAHWETLVRARAIENLSYVLAPNQVGIDARGNTCYGNSMIVSPWGEVLARATGTKEGIIYATLTRHALRNARRRLPGIMQHTT